MEIYVYSGVVTVLNVILLFALSLKVGITRAKQNVSIVETYTTTNKAFIVANRVHLNTLEGSVLFLPLLWVATLFSTLPQYAALVGFIWIVFRIAYALGYYKKTTQRTPGFVGALLCLVLLLGLSLYGFYFTLLV